MGQNEAPASAVPAVLVGEVPTPAVSRAVGVDGTMEIAKVVQPSYVTSEIEIHGGGFY